LTETFRNISKANQNQRQLECPKLFLKLITRESISSLETPLHFLLDVTQQSEVTNM